MKLVRKFNGIHVICFVKYYDKKFMGTNICNHPIVKLYTGDKIALSLAMPGKEKECIQVQCSYGEACTQTDDLGGQFFSPTTKKDLEEIVLVPAGDASDACSSTTERRVDFFDVCSGAVVTVVGKKTTDELTDSSDAVVAGDVALTTDPGKKLSDEGKKEMDTVMAVTTSELVSSPGKGVRQRTK